MPRFQIKSALNLVKLLNSPTNQRAAIHKRQMGTHVAHSTDIVWMDLEMTGLDVRKDKIIELSCLITDKDLNIKAEGPCVVINTTAEVLNGMDEWCTEHHTKSGLVQKCLASNISQAQAEQMFLEFLQEHIPQKQCPLAGSSVYMDRAFLREHMPRLDDYMHYRIIDVSSVKELARRWNPKVLEEAPKKRFAHRSLDDIVDSIDELKYYKQCFFKDAN